MTTRVNGQPNGERRLPTTGPPPVSSSNSNHQNHRHYYPMTPYRYSSSSASLKGCCCCLFLLLSFLALLVLAVILVIFLALKPKKPQFDLQQVGIQHMGITPNPASMNTSNGGVLFLKQGFVPARNNPGEGCRKASARDF